MNSNIEEKHFYSKIWDWLPELFSLNWVLHLNHPPLLYLQQAMSTKTTQSFLLQVLGKGYMNQKELRRINHMNDLSLQIPMEQYVFI